MVELLLDRYELQFAEIMLLPSSGGRFEVWVDGELVFSKLAEKRFPEDAELLDLVGARLGIG